MAQQPDASAARLESLDVLWIGDPGAALAALSKRAPQITITAHDVVSAGNALASDVVRADLVVIDTTADGFDVVRFLGQFESHQIDRPIVLLTHAGADDLAERANSFATCDCVVKTPDFVLQLPAAFSQVRARHDLQARLRASRQSLDRLRGIVELQPAVICVFGGDGILTAMNEAGRAMLATGIAPVVGQPIANFVPTSQRPSVADLIRRVCDGEPSEITLTLVRGDGQSLEGRLRAVPFQRGEHVVALATIREQPDWVVASPEIGNERDRLSSALRQAESEAAQLRAERAEWRTERALLEAQLRGTVNGEVEDESQQQTVTTLERELAQAVDHRLQLEAKLREATDRWATALHQVVSDHESLQREYARVSGERAALAAELRNVTDSSSAALRQALAELEELRTQSRAVRAGVEQEQEAQRRAALASPQPQIHATIEARHEESTRQVVEPAEPRSRPHLASEFVDTVKQLEIERDQLTRVLHLVTGRCEAAEAELRRFKSAAQRADKDRESEAATLEGLSVERDSLRTTLGQQHSVPPAAFEAEQESANSPDKEASTARTLIDHSADLLALDGKAVQILFGVVRVLSDVDQQLRLMVEYQQNTLT